MDPISIAQVVSGATGVAQSAWKVYDFINNARNVDETVRQIQEELKQVSDTCNLVKNKIKYSNDSELLKSIIGQVETCSAVVESIKSKLTGNKKSNIFTQAFRQLKLDMNEEDINRCRSRIQMSLLNLQLSLQLVNVQATYIGPRQVDNLLMTCLENIQKTLETHGEKLDKALRQCAESCISDANTVYSESIQGSVVGANTNVRNWLSELSIIDELTIQDRIEDDAYESDDSLDVELANSMLSSAQTAFKAKDYEKSESSFKEFLRSIKGLSKAKQREYDLQNIRVRLAIIAYHIHDLAIAEEALTSAITSENQDQDIKQEAIQCLIAVYVKCNKLDLAAATCENLYRCQRKVNRTGQQTYESLAWLARIYDLQGNHSRATACQDLIPVTIRGLRDWDPHPIPAQLRLSEPFAGKDLPLDYWWITCAWAHDNSLLALEVREPKYAIILRQVSTGDLVCSLEIGNRVICIAFDELDSKLAASFRSYNGNQLKFSIWNVQSGTLLRTIVLIEGATGLTAWPGIEMYVLKFVPSSDRIISVFQWLEDSCEIAVHATNTGSKIATLSANSFWATEIVIVRDKLFAIGQYDIRELDKDLRSTGGFRDLGIGRVGNCIKAVTCSPAGTLTIAWNDGSFSRYNQGESSMLDFKFSKADKNAMFETYLQYNRHRILIVLCQMRDGRKILAAPALNKQKELCEGHRFFCTFGLSPDAEYAFYVDRGHEGKLTLKAVLVSKHLGLPSYG